MTGQKLKNARTALKLTQEEVAEKIQISRQTLSNWENGKTYPDIVSVVKLSELYGISLDELLKDDEKMLKHMEDSMDTVKSNRALIIIWALCPVVFVLANLLAGGIVIGNRSISIHGPTFFYLLFLLMTLSLASLVTDLVRLSRRRAAAGGGAIKDVIGKSDVLRLSMSVFFLVVAGLSLWLLL